MVKILHDLSSGSVSDALRAVSPHPDVNVGEASGSCRIFSTRACRPFGSSGLNIKIQGFAGEKPLSRNRCRIYRSNSWTRICGGGAEMGGARSPVHLPAVVLSSSDHVVTSMGV